jgi:hypothetical protein
MTGPVEFLTIYCCFEDVPTVAKVLPTVLLESQRAGAAVIVHDCSKSNRVEMAALMQDLKQKHDFFFVHSDPISMGLSRNLAMWIGMEVFSPSYICMVEDDHGFREGLIPRLVEAMKRYYGQRSPNGLRYGLFTACPFCWGNAFREALMPVENGLHQVVDISKVPNLMAGGANSCFRCAPTLHWLSVLRGYDTDEYPISTFQTAGLNLRNYHKGFTALVVSNGDLVTIENRTGRGFTTDQGLRPFNSDFSARDPRSGFTSSLE